MSIYLDYNATSPLLPAAARAMEPFGRELYANPAALHPAGRAVGQALEQAREQLAATVNARPQHVLFCSGGTEALNQAILAISLARGQGHLVASAVEHAAVLRPLEWLQGCGFEVSLVRPQRSGLITPEAVAAACRPDTFLIAVQAANNELGTIQPSRAIADVAVRHGALMLVDGVQALGKLPLDLGSLGADLIAFSGHKVGGPKGIGALVVKSNVDLPPWIFGGPQEGGRRAGTPNVAGAVGFSVAAAEAVARIPEVSRKWVLLREELTSLTGRLPGCRQNGLGAEALPNTISLAFKGVDAAALTELLGQRGIEVSPGSACGCGGPGSHVLAAVGLDDAVVGGTIRCSMGPDISALELREAADQVIAAVGELRAAGGVACARS